MSGHLLVCRRGMVDGSVWCGMNPGEVGAPAWWSGWIKKAGLSVRVGSGKVGSVFRSAGVKSPSNPPVGAPQTYHSTVVPRFRLTPPRARGGLLQPRVCLSARSARAVAGE